MKTLIATLILASTAAYAMANPSPAAVEAPLQDAPVLATQYSAVLHARSGQWQLFDAAGHRLQFRAEGCPSNPYLPHGLWLLTRDAADQPELIAPSATPLPAGHDGRIALRPCGSPQEDRDVTGSLQLPAAFLATLEQHGNAILISE